MNSHASIRRSRAMLYVCASAATLSMFSTAQADPIGNPGPFNGWDTTSAVSIVRRSGQRDTELGAAGRTVINIINGSGIDLATGKLHVNAPPAGPSGLEGDFANAAGGGDAGDAPNPGTDQAAGSHWVEFGFDQSYSLTDVAIWNDNQSTYYMEGWKHLEIQTAQTDSTNPADWTTVFNGILPLSAGAGNAPTAPSLVLDLSSLNINAQYVTLINTGQGNEQNYRNEGAGANCFLSEVRFNSGLVTPPPPPQVPEWTTDSSGDWLDVGNWVDHVPNGIGEEARFYDSPMGGSTTGARTVYADSAVTAGILRFNSTHSYVLDGAGSLTIQVSTGSALIDIQGGSPKINLPLYFASDTTINMATGLGMTIGNPTTIRANKTVTKNGPITMTATLALESGATLVDASGGFTVFKAPNLSTGAKVDLKSNSMTVDYRGVASPADTIKGQLTTGYAGGAWTGAGITTSSATAGQTGLGWIDNPATQSIQVSFVRYGDSNLDGQVDTSDFTALSQNFNSATGVWATGDFNYDGVVNALDFNALASNYGQTVPAPALGSLVPEPTSLAMIGAIGALFGTRRRQGRQSKKIKRHRLARAGRASLCASASVASVALVSGTQAQPIGNPNSGNGWSTTSAVSIVAHSGEAGSREVVHIIDGGGMSGTNGELAAYEPGAQGFPFFADFRNNSGVNASAPNPGTIESTGSHWVEFGLNQSYSLTDMAIWNDNENDYDFGWKHIAVQVSTTGGTNPSDWTTVFTGDLPQSPGAGIVAGHHGPTLPSLVVPIGNIAAQYVTLVDTGLGTEASYYHDYNGGDDGGNDAILSEVRFNSGLTAGTPPVTTWNNTTGGSWFLSSNWGTYKVPNGPDKEARLYNAITAARTVTLDALAQVGTLRFNSTNEYNIGGAGTLEMAVSTGSGLIDVQVGTHKINVPLNFNSNTTVDVAPGAALVLGNPVTVLSNTTVTTSGSVSVQAPLILQDGAVFAPSGAVALSSVPSMGAGSKIDLKTNSLTIDYGSDPAPTDQVKAKLTSAYASGDWSGSGITTTSAIAGKTGVGWVNDAADHAITMEYTYYGDANLDGKVDTSDFTALAAHFGASGVWAGGDFNYDGTINALDFNALASNFGQTVAAPSLGVNVPEPVSLVSLSVLAMVLRRRRTPRGA